MYMSIMTANCRAIAVRGAYDAHQALWRVFGDHPDRERDFLYRRTGENAFLTVSVRPPEDAAGLWAIRTKEYAPRLTAGERVYFALCANPVRKARDAHGKQKRHDVVQDARKKLEERGVPKDEWPTRPALAQKAGFEWLTARQEHLGIELEEEGFLVEAYTLQAFAKARSREGRVHLGVLDMKGFARVEDPKRLHEALMQGVGPAKAYGCGLLTVMRAA